MSITKKEKETIEFYERQAQEWAAHHGPDSKESLWKKELEMFHHYLPSGSILEIGSGGAKEAAHLIKMGYTYTGVDASEKLVSIAQKRFPQATFVCQNVYDLDFPVAQFDGFWCAAVLLHIPKENIDKALQNIKRVVKPGGIGFISVVEGSGEYHDEKTGRHFFLYGAEEFADILRKNGFIIEKQAVRKQDTHRTWLQSWLTFFVRV